MSDKRDMDEVIRGIGGLIDGRQIEARCYKCSKTLVSEEFYESKCVFCGSLEREEIKILPIVLN